MSNKRPDDFSGSTKKSILKKSSARCSIRGCYTYCDNGYVCHIYPATEGGPHRSYDSLNSELNDDNRKSPSNAIYTCRNCAYLIDGKPYIKDYPAVDLILFKAVSEYSIRLLGKYEDLKFFEKNYGYASYINAVWDVVARDLPELYFGFKIDSSNDIFVKESLKEKFAFHANDIQYEGRIENLAAYKKSIKEWTKKSDEWFKPKEEIKNVSWLGSWFISIESEKNISSKCIYGKTANFIFTREGKFNFKDKYRFPIISCEIHDNHLYNFHWTLDAYNDGSRKLNLEFSNIHHIKLTTVDNEVFRDYLSHLELIEGLLTGNTDKIKVHISDYHCYQDEINSGTLMVESHYEISDAVKLNYTKIINLFRKIEKIKHESNIDFFIDFGLYLRNINELEMFSALNSLMDNEYSTEIFIGSDSNFRYYLNSQKNLMNYRIKRKSQR